MQISCVNVLTGVSASSPELRRFRFVTLHCQHKHEAQESADRCGTAMNVTDGQKDRSTEKAKQTEKPLHAGSLQHRKYSYRGGQTEHCHGIPTANGLHDLAPELCPQSCRQGNGCPSLGSPYLLGSDTNCGQGDKVEDRAHEAAVLYHKGSKQSPYLAAGDEGPVAFQVLQKHWRHVNWASVGIPTMISAIVVAHGHLARAGAASGRTREAANAVASTIA
jgi:glutaredoxin